MRQAEPDIRPLGGLALGFAVLSALFAVSYFFSPLAYLAAALAVPLGVMARGDERIRTMGTAAVAIAAVAIVLASVVLAPSILS
jgi:hypothetical protein